jgi:hypothetical protein
MNLANSKVGKGGKISGMWEKVEKRRGMLSAGRNRHDERYWETHHRTPQYLIVI